MTHESAEVRYHALAAVQNYMSNAWYVCECVSLSHVQARIMIDMRFSLLQGLLSVDVLVWGEHWPLLDVGGMPMVNEVCCE